MLAGNFQRLSIGCQSPIIYFGQNWYLLRFHYTQFDSGFQKHFGQTIQPYSLYMYIVKRHTVSNTQPEAPRSL